MAAAAAATPASKSDCIRAIRSYIDKMIKPKDRASEVLGMKALLLDKETVRALVTRWPPPAVTRLSRVYAQKAIVGMVYTMHEILEKEGTWCGGVGVVRSRHPLSAVPSLL